MKAPCLTEQLLLTLAVVIGLAQCASLPERDIWQFFRGGSRSLSSGPSTHFVSPLTSSLPGEHAAPGGTSNFLRESGPIRDTGQSRLPQAEVQPTRPRARIPVEVPQVLPVVSAAEREEELYRLFNEISLSSNAALRPRPVLPLFVDNMDARRYADMYRILIGRPWGRLEPAQHFWTVGQRTYMLDRPQKGTQAFAQMHGRKGKKNENFATIWRLERFGEAKIWRYLGVLEMPSYRTANNFMRTHMEAIPRTDPPPSFYFNDAAHLDPSQSAANIPNAPFV